ncbi:class I ribonucleotide reductase maintenance protein YfaE [Aliiglaciecola sp. LCG003]|uniref:class I ribonucleotide reductase maintenance protein YfaE n=1 Tax=Aliiglaciecola sp. LCG003 TaxID=3053655 RepID=UPI002572ECBD|nr:class I ribonucleotide reductase maintenance protein YfaE [Aliiglaciecola sp. LCG003]WJG11153.1 class I ribonucleotide reductase maintenance protein YfaE [Aliiglaciecola sp. LCG003]
MSSKDNLFVITVGDHPAFPYQSDDTVLECLEKHNIEVHFHCREGFCGACRTTMLSGDVEYTTDPLAYIDDDEILPCCCTAKSDLHLKLGN